MSGAMGYSVDYGALELVADAAHQVAEQAPRAVEGMRLNLVPGALPGSMSASRAQSTDAELVTTAGQLCQALEGFSDAMHATAKGYRAIEDEAADAATEFFGSVP